jgi:NADPH2:quinone reductase
MATENGSKSGRMRAMVMTGWGGPEVLQLRNFDRPRQPEGHEVLVSIRAAGVNPADWMTRARPIEGYNFGDLSDAMILGLDGAGVVGAVGNQVSRFAVGDRVYFVDGGFGSYPGNYQEWKLLHEDVLAHMPARLSFAQAAAVPTTMVTAWEGLDRASVEKDQFVLIQAGAGGVGHLAVQIARARGAHVAATVSGDAKASVVADLGAELVINYRNEDVGEKLRAWSGKDGADIVYDTVGGDTFARSLALVAPYGTLVCCAAFPWPAADPFPAMMRGIRIIFENMGLPQILGDLRQRRQQSALLEEAAGLFDSGALKVVLAETHSLEQAGEAHLGLEHGRALGRVALDFAL